MRNYSHKNRYQNKVLQCKYKIEKLKQVEIVNFIIKYWLYEDIFRFDTKIINNDGRVTFEIPKENILEIKDYQKD